VQSLERAQKRASTSTTPLGPRKRSTRLIAKEVQRAEEELKQKERAEQERLQRIEEAKERKRLLEEKKLLEREQRRLQRLQEVAERNQLKVRRKEREADSLATRSSSLDSDRCVGATTCRESTSYRRSRFVFGSRRFCDERLWLRAGVANQRARHCSHHHQQQQQRSQRRAATPSRTIARVSFVAGN